MAKKVNPYIIVIVILLLVVAGLLYNQWGKKIFPASIEGTKGNDTNTEILENDIVIGNEDAPVTIVEYFSYLCGYCRMFDEQTKPKIIENYVRPGKVKFIFRPYSIFAVDPKINESVLCANEQEKFFEYHDYVFGNIGDSESIEDLKIFAKDIGLDEDKFNQCFDSGKYETRVREWQSYGNNDFEKAGILSEKRGTPAFVINGEMLVGAQPYEKFVEVIEKKLAE